MPTSIAQTRQRLSTLIAAAQRQPQVITNRNTPVAVLVSADYFAQSEAVAKPAAHSLYTQLQQLRETFVPQDDTGLGVLEPTERAAAWHRANRFADPRNGGVV